MYVNFKRFKKKLRLTFEKPCPSEAFATQYADAFGEKPQGESSDGANCQFFWRQSVDVWPKFDCTKIAEFARRTHLTRLPPGDLFAFQLVLDKSLRCVEILKRLPLARFI